MRTFVFFCAILFSAVVFSQEKEILLSPGETKFVQITINGTTVTAVTVPNVTAPEKTLTFTFGKDEVGGQPMMLLTVKNGTKNSIKYSAYMQPVKGGDFVYTSSCPVLPNNFQAHETWPHPIGKLKITDIRLIDTQKGNVSCE